MTRSIGDGLGKKKGASVNIVLCQIVLFNAEKGRERPIKKSSFPL